MTVRSGTPSYISMHRSAVREVANDRVLSRPGMYDFELGQLAASARTNLGVRGSNPFGRAILLDKGLATAGPGYDRFQPCVVV